MAASSCATQPETSWARVSGTASCRCVRPILTMSLHSAARLQSVSVSVWTAGSSSVCSCSTMTRCMTAGKVSLLDWPRLTWSLGCTGLFVPSGCPAISLARLAMTSLAFMLECVPLPVCQTTRGK